METVPATAEHVIRIQVREALISRVDIDRILALRVRWRGGAVRANDVRARPIERLSQAPRVAIVVLVVGVRHQACYADTVQISAGHCVGRYQLAADAERLVEAIIRHIEVPIVDLSGAVVVTEGCKVVSFPPVRC